MSAAPSGKPPFVARLVMHGFQVVGVLLASIVVMTMLTSLWWRLTPQRDLDILVYDQTVTDAAYTQHAALAQVMDYQRVDYDIEDYVGITPGTWEQRGTWPTDRPDLIVLANVTGVYVDADGNPDPNGGRFVSQALSSAQADDVARWVDGGTPAYAEFALVTEPTPPAAAATLEEVFGFTASGWRIRMFDDLATVSPAVQSLGISPWPYAGPGMIAVSGPDGGRDQPRHLVVLTDADLTRGRLEIVGGPPGSPGGVTSYDGWVSVVAAAEDAEVDAAFEVPVTENGARILAQAGVPTRFAALIRTERTVYFAGSGLDDETPFRLRRLKGGATFTRLVTGHEFQFLYRILEPTFGWLLEQVPEAQRSEN